MPPATRLDFDVCYHGAFHKIQLVQFARRVVKLNYCTDWKVSRKQSRDFSQESSKQMSLIKGNPQLMTIEISSNQLPDLRKRIVSGFIATMMFSLSSNFRSTHANSN